MKRRRTVVFCSLIAILAGLVITAVFVGDYKVTISDFFGYVSAKITGSAYDGRMETVLINLRLPRIIAAIVFGAALSVAGLVYQNVFTNNMISPDLLGASSSAACGAALSIILGFSKGLGFFGAFVFSVFSIVATNLLSKLLNRKDSLLIAGIIVGGIARSCLGLLKYLADPENGQLESIVYWEMGSLSKVHWEELRSIAVITLLIIALLFLLRRRICCLTFGRFAELLGIKYTFERAFVIIAASLLVALTTSVCGVISWVGLIVPILSADLTKSGSFEDNIVTTGLVGSVFLLFSDTLIRLISSSEIPISIMTGAGGLIVFVISVFAERRDYAE